MEDYNVTLIESLEDDAEDQGDVTAAERLFNEIAGVVLADRPGATTPDLPDFEIEDIGNPSTLQGKIEEMFGQQMENEEKLDPVAEKKARNLLDKMYKLAETGEIDNDVVGALQEYYGKRTNVMNKINQHLEDVGSKFRLLHDPKTNEYSVTGGKEGVEWKRRK